MSTKELSITALLKGMSRTIRRTFRRKFTVQYPEERKPTPKGYRGLHRLNRDEKGRVKCVACFLCATACPARCITIEPGPSPWPDREKYPVAFEIEELRCIYCGMCEEACPVGAIELTLIYDFSFDSREKAIFDKEMLLKVYDITTGQEE